MTTTGSYRGQGCLRSNYLAVSFGSPLLLHHVVHVGGVLVHRAVLGHGKILVSVFHDLLVLLTPLLRVILAGSVPPVGGDVRGVIPGPQSDTANISGGTSVARI